MDPILFVARMIKLIKMILFLLCSIVFYDKTDRNWYPCYFIIVQNCYVFAFKYHATYSLHAFCCRAVDHLQYAIIRVVLFPLFFIFMNIHYNAVESCICIYIYIYYIHIHNIHRYLRCTIFQEVHVDNNPNYINSLSSRCFPTLGVLGSGCSIAFFSSRKFHAELSLLWRSD